MPDTQPPWLRRMTVLLGLYEIPGDDDNAQIIAMAQVCGGSIAREYVHDSIAWCALAANYCLIAEGFPGDGTLWALDFARYGTRLAGPAVGAIATKTRNGGGHVFLVVGRTAGGQIVGRGGNQSDMVCDELFDPSAITGYNWPASYPAPASVGFSTLPVVVPAPKEKRAVTLLPRAGTQAAPQNDAVPQFAALVPGGYCSSTPFDKSIPVSIRCNNPGALNIAPWIRSLPGYVGDKVTSVTSGPNSTVIFSAPEYGVSAWYQLLVKYRAAGAVTIDQIITRYGGVGQDYSGYVAAVAALCGLPDDTEIKLTGDDATLLKFARAMFRYEAGRPGPLSDAQINYGFALARGATPLPSSGGAAVPKQGPTAGPAISTPPPIKAKTKAGAAGAVIVAGGAAAAQAHSSGVSAPTVVAIVVLTALAAVLVYYVLHRK
jgi:uncharacterized protein (TIGR02594 family)